MKVIRDVISQAVYEAYEVKVVPELSRPEPQFGDVSCNIALQLSKQLGENPREIGQAIADKLAVLPELGKVTLAGPGFINITLSDKTLWQQAIREPAKSLKGQRILVEYSDPNPFKPLHAGHLYTTLVGDTIARLVENAGAETIRLNYGGDVGLHVARSMWAIVKYLGGEYPEKLAEIAENERPSWMGARYVEGTTADEEDEAAHDEIVEYNKRVYQIHHDQDHSSPFAQIYWTCRQWSYDYFPELYRQLDVVPFARFIPESEVTPLGLDTVTAHIGDVYEKSRESDAIVYDGEKYGLHTRVFINSHGLPTYETKDVGLSLTKWRDYEFDRSIIITAVEQQQYMQVVIKSIEQFAPEPAKRTTHLTHGAVKLAGGVKMSSRRGNVLMALDILEAARQAAANSGHNASEEVMLAAVKYSFVRSRLGSDVIYDPAESVALEGNSGPYLQYAHARACSIIDKAKTLANSAMKEVVFEPGERLLARKLTEYNEVVEKATNDLAPHSICTYLYELAQEFNRFYEHNRVIGDRREGVRLALVVQYRDILARGLNVIGIYAPEKM